MAAATSSVPPVPLPPGFTAQMAKELQEKFKQMSQNGTPHNDPEYLKTVGMLKTIQQRVQYSRQVAEQRQAQAKGQQQNTQNGQNVEPGQQNGAAASKPGQTAPNTSANAARQNGNPTFQPAAGLDFDTMQLELLRHQVYAFKMLSKSMPIPQPSLDVLFKPKEPAPIPVNNALKPPVTGKMPADAATAGTVPKHESPAPSKQDTIPPLRARTPFAYKSFQDPYIHPAEFDLSKPVLYSNLSDRRARPLRPSLMPPGVDYERVQHEREAMIYNRIMNRIEDLKNLGADKAYWDFTKSDKPIPNTDVDLKHRLQLLKLQLLPKQRLLRQTISLDVLHADNLAQTANRSAYRKRKKLTSTDARQTEKLEKAQRDQRETKEKTKQREQLDAIIAHAREIRENALDRKTRFAKVGRLVQQCQLAIEKEEQKRIERTAKQRLQALKNDDEATYLKLLGQAKDSRISHLLQQTDGFLNQLAASVKQQQRNAKERYDSQAISESEESEIEEDEDGNPKVDYYEVAHRIKEEVKAQPNILIGGTLKEYQLKGLQWMISLYNNNLNGILADEMGLGKTIQTISLVTYLVEKKNSPGPFLVIVPLSTLTNWNLEFERWAPSLNRIVYKGTPPVRRAQQALIRQGQFQVLLTTYEYVIKDRPVLSKIKWVHMIIDEGHRMKNSQSKLSSTLTTYYHTRYRLILTGTPLQNNLPELWALLNFVLPNIFKSVKSFDEWFNTPFANTGNSDRIELTEEEQLLIIRRLHKVLRPFLLRRLKKDVEKDLPDKQERVIKCKFSALQARLYKQLVTSSKLNITDANGGKTSIRGLSNMLMQLRKLCNHPFVFEQVENEVNPKAEGRDFETNDFIWRSAGKFELLDRVLPKFKATGHRVLLFFQMTQIMNIMEDFLRLKGLHYLRLDGATKSEDRSDLLKKFNAPDSPYFCFLLSTRAGGLGLNLQTADTVIIYDSDWNPFQDLQAQDRAHRIGQKNEVRILRLISSNSVEEKILERARFKLNMDTKVIQAGKFDNKTSSEERETLLRALLDSQETADALNEQEEMDDDDLNTAMARDDSELELFKQMDIDRANDPVYGDGKMPRLMSDAEVPNIFLQEDVPEEVAEELVGRGARERVKVRYDDGLTEEQFAMAVDAEEDLESVIAAKQARIDRRQAKKDQRGRTNQIIESSPSRQSSEEPPTTATRKRGRKSGGIKRKAPEPEEETPVKQPPAKRGRQNKIPDTLTPKKREELQKIMDSVYDFVIDLQEDFENEDGTKVPRELIAPFMKLVPKSQYPDYYMHVKEPISMEQIGKRINKFHYQSLKEFVADVRLLANNARTYNEDGSWLYKDATTIENTAMQKLKEVIIDYPDWQDWEGSGQTSQAGETSGTGTPKITLKFGGNKGAGISTPNGKANGAANDEE